MLAVIFNAIACQLRIYVFIDKRLNSLSAQVRWALYEKAVTAGALELTPFLYAPSASGVREFAYNTFGLSRHIVQLSAVANVTHAKYGSINRPATRRTRQNANVVAAISSSMMAESTNAAAPKCQ